MNGQDLRTLLDERANALDTTQPQQLTRLHARIRTTRRRRAATAVASGALGVALVTGVGVMFAGGTDRSAPPDPSRPDGPPAGKITPLTYAVSSTASYPERSAEPRSTIHYGGRTIDVPDLVTVVQPTQDGVVFVTDDDRVWFTDGSKPEELGETGPGIARGWRIAASPTGSIAAWLEPDTSRMVVYDTAAQSVLDRHRLGDAVGRVYPIHDYSISTAHDDVVYWTLHGTVLRYDVATRQSQVVSEATYEEDLTSMGRFLAAGPTAGEARILGQVTYGGLVGYHYFAPDGSRLEAENPRSRGGGATTFWDTRTDQPVRPLSLPADYVATHPYFALVQWLDDDRVVVWADTAGWSEIPQHTGDLLECRLSSGQCVLAEDHPGATFFVVPGNPFS